MMISEELNNTDIGQSLEHCERQRNGRDELSAHGCQSEEAISTLKSIQNEQLSFLTL